MVQRAGGRGKGLFRLSCFALAWPQRALFSHPAPTSSLVPEPRPSSRDDRLSTFRFRFRFSDFRFSGAEFCVGYQPSLYTVSLNNFQGAQLDQLGGWSRLSGLPGNNRPIAHSIGQLEAPCRFGAFGKRFLARKRLGI